MKKTVILIVVISVCTVFAVFFVIEDTKKRDLVCFEKDCFGVQLAKTQQQRESGLMFKKNLDKNSGMLFIFEKEGHYSFWMKNTFIPLDIIWINENKEVVFISKNNNPCFEGRCPLINPGKTASYVLEINGGMAERIGLVVGKKAEISLISR